MPAVLGAVAMTGSAAASFGGTADFGEIVDAGAVAAVVPTTGVPLGLLTHAVQALAAGVTSGGLARAGPARLSRSIRSPDVRSSET